MFIYLSRWNLFGTAVASILGAYLVTGSYFERIKKTNGMDKVLRLYWFLSNNSVVFSCVVSSIYWTLLYRGQQSSLNNYLVHATNSIFLVIDLFVVKFPHKMSHFIYPMSCGTLYLFFTIIYTYLGGVDRDGKNYVYPVLDWKNKPHQSMIVGMGCVILLGVFHVIVGFLHRIRSKLHKYVTESSVKISNEQILPFVINDRKL